MSADNRRPIKARSIGIIQSAAASLARSSVTPNQISAASVVVSFLVPVSLCLWGPASWLGCLVAILGIQLRLLCNLLDGMVAIEGAKKSKVGDIYNEFPDRLSDTIILLGFGYAAPGSMGPVLAWAAGFFSVLTAYTRVLGASVGTKHFYLGPMAKQHRMALLTVVLLVLPLCSRFEQGVTKVIEGTLLFIIMGAVITTVRRLGRIGGELNSRS